MKVAQYEVLGNIQKKETRPERDVLALRKPRSRDPSRNFLSSLAGRTFLLYRYPALRTGLLSFDPSGTSPSGVSARRAIHCHKSFCHRCVAKSSAKKFSGKKTVNREP
jgi:hypothetical protein